MAKKNYDELARAIIKNVGGKENILSVTHCATRLRFSLKDNNKADTEAMKRTPGVAQVLVAMGQYQVVIGSHVADVYEPVCRLAGVSTGKQQGCNPAEGEKKKGMALVLDFISGSLGPIFPPFTAAGVLKGLLVIATMCGLSSESGIYQLFNAIGDAIFYFLPIFLGYSVAKKLGSNPATGMLAGAILCYPNINSTDIELFGIVFNVKYTSTFLPIILVMLLVAPLEKWFNKRLPTMIRSFATPLFTLCIAMPLGYCIIGPLANGISTLLAAGMNALYAFGALPVGILAGAFWQVLVVFGVHQVLTTACYNNFFNGTGDLVLAVSIIVAFAQSATIAAMVLRTKNKEFKELAVPAMVSGIFGITEPAIYGITLPRIKYFIISCVGGLAAGIICALFGVRKYTFGSGIFALPTLINTADPQVWPIVLAVVAAIGISFALSFALFKEEDI